MSETIWSKAEEALTRFMAKKPRLCIPRNDDDDDSRIDADDPNPDPATMCPECKGRGWNPGDCHPREECGVCEGTGRKEPDRE